MSLMVRTVAPYMEDKCVLIDASTILDLGRKAVGPSTIFTLFCKSSSDSGSNSKLMGVSMSAWAGLSEKNMGKLVQ